MSNNTMTYYDEFLASQEDAVPVRLRMIIAGAKAMEISGLKARIAELEGATPLQYLEMSSVEVFGSMAEALSGSRVCRVEAAPGKPGRIRIATERFERCDRREDVYSVFRIEADEAKVDEKNKAG